MFISGGFWKVDKLLILLFILIGAGCSAESNFYGEIDHFGFSMAPNSDPMLLPTHMMDDEALFRNAEIQREFPMTELKRKLNYEWLLFHHNKTYEHSGTAVLARLVRNTLLDYYKSNLRSGSSRINMSNANQTEVTLNHYKLRVSDERVLIAYEYRF